MCGCGQDSMAVPWRCFGRVQYPLSTVTSRFSITVLLYSSIKYIIVVIPLHRTVLHNWKEQLQVSKGWNSCMQQAELNHHLITHPYLNPILVCPSGVAADAHKAGIPLVPKDRSVNSITILLVQCHTITCVLLHSYTHSFV